MSRGSVGTVRSARRYPGKFRTMKTRATDETRRKLLAGMLAAPSALLAGCGGEGETPFAALGTSTEALTAQELMDLFYDIGNVVTINVTMSATEWETLRNEWPVGSPPPPPSNNHCNGWNADPNVDRFPWHMATEVEVSGTAFPPTPLRLQNVGIKKKSFCGSFSASRPALKLDFGEYVAANKAMAEAAIGTSHLTLNNNQQDASCIRQPLGYLLYKLAGLPNSRCNLVKVLVNGERLGTMYCNVEPVRERYIERHFGSLGGNLYEFEKDDFVEDRIPYIDVEKLSPIKTKADLTFAARHLIEPNRIVRMSELFDITYFNKMYAMETLLKHWDGYTHGLNNTYVYNERPSQPNPGVGSIWFKILPWGIDQILQPGQPFRASTGSLLSQIVRGDSGWSGDFVNQVRALRQSVFTRGTLEGTVTSFINQMESILTAEVSNVSAEIAIVRQQLKLARAAAYWIAGLPSTSAVSFLDKASGDCLHASNSETIPAGVANPLNWEVVHRAPQNASSERWFVNGFNVRSEAYGRSLHASASIRSPQNHLLLYTTNSPNSSRAQDFAFEQVDDQGTPVPFSSDQFTGYFRIRSLRTGLYLCYGDDDRTPGTGRPRVYQAGASQAANVFHY